MCTACRLLQFIICLATPLVITACTSHADAPRRYELQGQILAIRPDAGEVVERIYDGGHWTPDLIVEDLGRVLAGS